VLEDVQMEYKGNSASEEMAELSETIKNIYNNNIHEDKMAVSCATATMKCIYEEYYMCQSSVEQDASSTIIR
jgi:hypothetical protein